MDVKELELSIMQNKSVTLESFELQDFLAEKSFHIDKGVKIAKEIDELKSVFSSFSDCVESLNQRLSVISEVLTEWNTDLNPSFVSEYEKVFEYLKDFERDTKESKKDFESHLSEITDLNNQDF